MPSEVNRRAISLLEGPSNAIIWRCLGVSVCRSGRPGGIALLLRQEQKMSPGLGSQLSGRA